jgi:hypothetical protein
MYFAFDPDIACARAAASFVFVIDSFDSASPMRSLTKAASSQFACSHTNLHQDSEYDKRDCKAGTITMHRRAGKKHSDTERRHEPLLDGPFFEHVITPSYDN